MQATYEFKVTIAGNIAATHDTAVEYITDKITKAFTSVVTVELVCASTPPLKGELWVTATGVVQYVTVINYYPAEGVVVFEYNLGHLHNLVTRRLDDFKDIFRKVAK